MAPCCTPFYPILLSPISNTVPIPSGGQNIQTLFIYSAFRIIGPLLRLYQNTVHTLKTIPTSLTNFIQYFVFIARAVAIVLSTFLLMFIIDSFWLTLSGLMRRRVLEVLCLVITYARHVSLVRTTSRCRNTIYLSLLLSLWTDTSPFWFTLVFWCLLALNSSISMILIIVVIFRLLLSLLLRLSSVLSSLSLILASLSCRISDLLLGCMLWCRVGTYPRLSH